MNIEEQIEYWKTTAVHDIEVAESLFQNKHYVWCLFLGHITIEKILKAHYVKDNKKTPPKIHDLVKLASKTLLQLSKENLLFLDRINDFNIEARYPDYKNGLYKIFTKEFTGENLNQIKELFQWLQSQLK